MICHSQAAALKESQKAMVPTNFPEAVDSTVPDAEFLDQMRTVLEHKNRRCCVPSRLLELKHLNVAMASCHGKLQTSSLNSGRLRLQRSKVTIVYRFAPKDPPRELLVNVSYPVDQTAPAFSLFADTLGKLR